MRLNFIVSGLMVLGMVCCSNPTGNVNYRLTDEQLSHLMFDLQLGEVAVSEQDPGMRRDSLQQLFWKRMAEIYKMPEAELKAEIRNLEGDPDKMKVILDRTQVLADSVR